MSETDELPTPDPPEQLPNYVVDPVERQSSDDLRDLAAWAIELADAKEQRAEQQLDDPPASDADSDTTTETIEKAKVDVDELRDDVDDMDDVDDGTTLYLYLQKIPCGPGCSKCPHGPYTYAKWRDGDTVRTKYVPVGETPLGE